MSIPISLSLRCVREADGWPAGSLRRGLLQSIEAHESREETFTEEIREGLSHRQLISPNPCLSAAEQRHLDEHGLIQPGTIVSEGDVLASLVEGVKSSRSGFLEVHDDSWRTPADWDQAEVVSVTREVSSGRRREFPIGVLERLTIRLRQLLKFDPTAILQIGELRLRAKHLLDDEQLPADLVLPHRLADLLDLPAGEVREFLCTQVGESAERVLSARATGIYSLITRMPLGAKMARRRGVDISLRQFDWLQRMDQQLRASGGVGLLANLQELISLKSNDLQNRPLLQALADDASTEVTLAAPETFFLNLEELWGLGLKVIPASARGHVSLTLGPASTEEIQQRSSGEVKKPETINYRTYQPVKDGLFCETIFGLENSAVRRRRSGHLELQHPIVSLLWRNPQQPVLANILELTHDDLEAILFHQKQVFVRNGERQLRDVNEASPPDLEAQGWSDLGHGVAALKALLSQVPDERIPAAFRTANGDGAQSTSCAWERFFLTAVPVIPPDLRPLVLLSSGNFATSDLNDHYRRLINRNNRLAKLVDLNAPPVIIWNEQRELQRTADALFANAWFTDRRAVLAENDLPLKSILDMLYGRTQELRHRVEWAGEARGVTDTTMPAGNVGVPAFLFDELQLDANTPVLLTTWADFIARLPIRIPGSLMHLAPCDGEPLRLQDTDSVAVHRPLTRAAVDELQQLQDVHASPTQPVDDGDCWFRAQDQQGFLQGLVNAAVNNTPCAMNSVEALVSFGTGPTMSQLPPEPAPSEPVFIPWQPPAAAEPPAFSEIERVTRERARLAYHLIPAPADATHAAAGGRLGGIPRVPRGTVWPLDQNGSPMTFIGQFSLEPARSAGILPIDVPENSLLTVFYNGEWENCCSSQTGSLLIHPDTDLIELAVPATVSIAPPISLNGQLLPTYETFEETLRVSDWEREAVTSRNARVLRQYRENYRAAFQNNEFPVSIGGHPQWVQAEDNVNVVVQIRPAMAPLYNLEGTLYIYGDDAQTLRGYIQGY